MGYNPDILENIVQRAGGPRDIYFPIYPDYNPCTNIIQRRKIVQKTDILTNISVLCYNISEYQDQRTLLFYFYPMYNGKYVLKVLPEPRILDLQRDTIHKMACLQFLLPSSKRYHLDAPF